MNNKTKIVKEFSYTVKYKINIRTVKALFYVNNNQIEDTMEEKIPLATFPLKRTVRNELTGNVQN